MHFYEFFSGGGMARLGLGSRWQCLFANDCCPKKNRAYRENFPPAHELFEADIRALTPADLPGRADLAWASFPCQDLSLAGRGQGLKGERSGTFWPFWELMQGLAAEDRAPKLIVLENVKGAITSNKGRDFPRIVRAFVRNGYRCGALVIDAAHFLPQSRERLFIIAVRDDIIIPADLLSQRCPNDVWRPASLRAVRRRLRQDDAKAWLWWRLPLPDHPRQTLAQIIETEPTGVAWHSPEATARLLSMMAPRHRQRVADAMADGRPHVGAAYKRMRRIDGGSVQRVEVRFDDLAGCLRTPSGGSSRQTLMFVDGASVRSRLMSPREAARLMGVPERYRIPRSYNDACWLFGDGVAAPVVSWLSRHLLEPILDADARPPLRLAAEAAEAGEPVAV